MKERKQDTAGTFYISLRSEKKAFGSIIEQWNDRFYCESLKLLKEQQSEELQSFQKIEVPSEKLFQCENQIYILLKNNEYKEVLAGDAAGWLNFHGHDLPEDLKKYETMQKF